jgi:dehydrogenase/reductase SDR family protein 7B
MDHFRHKVVLVTGASSGLGLALVFELAALEGCSIVAASRDKGRMSSSLSRRGVSTRNIQSVQIDLESTPEDIRKGVDTALACFGRIDILVNCAGMGFRGLVVDTVESVDRRIMQVDYFGQVSLIKAILALWRENEQLHGDIIQISSVQALFGLGERAAYSAAKHALHGFIGSLRAEIDDYPKRSHLRVFEALPGHICTNHSLNAITGNGDSYNKEDASTKEGYEPGFVARRILSGVNSGTREIVIADWRVKALILLRTLFPPLAFRLLRNRLTGSRESFMSSIVNWIKGR